MQIEAASVFQFVHECDATLRLCHRLLGFPVEEFSLDALLNLARQGRVARRGEVSNPNSKIEVDYHIHGSGFTLTNQITGTELRFDVRNEDGQLRITISAWEVQQFLKSTAPLSAIESELRRLSLEHSSLVHVHNDPISYFYCTGLPQKRIRGPRSE